MSKLFMYGSDLQELEKLIILVPNFLPRRSGVIVVQRIKNEPDKFKPRKNGGFITDYFKSSQSSSVSKQITSGSIIYEEIIGRGEQS